MHKYDYFLIKYVEASYNFIVAASNKSYDAKPVNWYQHKETNLT